jgi:hypothetical protein
MSKSVSKSILATNVIDAITNLVEAINTKIDGTFMYTDIYLPSGTSAVQANFIGNGEGEMAISGIVDHKSVSSHTSLFIEAHKHNLNEKAKILGRAFYEMFPNQPLCWGYISQSGKHTLNFGNAVRTHKQENHEILNTQLARWKKPLIDLSNYMEQEEMQKDMKQWLFLDDQSVRNIDHYIGKIGMREISAPSLKHALTLNSCYDSYNEAITIPRVMTTTGVCEVLEAQNYQDLMQDIMENVPSLNPEELETVLKQIQSSPGGSQTLHRVLSDMEAVFSYEIILDIVSNVVQINMHEEPFQSPEEIATAGKSYDSLKRMSVNLCTLLHKYLLKIHPNMKNGILRITNKDVENPNYKYTTWSFNIDGAGKSCYHNTLFILFETASMMRWTGQDGTQTMYAVKKKNENWRTAQNIKHGIPIIKAKNPRLALVMYLLKTTNADETLEIFRVKFISKKSILEAQNAIQDSLREIYKV